MIIEGCPHCGVALNGAVIPDEYFVSIPKPVEPQYFRREIGVEVSGVYDGTLYWLCPDCGGMWPRFSEGHRLHGVALEYIAKAQKVQR